MWVIICENLTMHIIRILLTINQIVNTRLCHLRRSIDDITGPHLADATKEGLHRIRVRLLCCI